LNLGLHHFGENYCQEWQSKAAKLTERKSEIFWHFIGHLQSNKVKEVVGHVEYIHTLDSLKLAAKVSKRAESLGLKQKALLEINLAAEDSKSGFLIEDLHDKFAELSALPGLAIRGLMCIPPVGPNAEASRPYFKKLKSLLDEWNRSGIFTPPLTELSMGMSQDFEVAIAEGATMIRVGTELFGPRN
jgi:pyridoxal phosphate enzyme (YggS family)